MYLKPGISEKDHYLGNQNGKIEIVEFGDYQCLNCAAAYPIVKEILETFGAKIKFVFRHFPRVHAHPYAKIAADVAEAANLQGKFWEMHDAIYEKQSKLDADFIFTLAEQLDLDITQLKVDMLKSEVQEKIENDFESGARSGVNGTPCFFLNGERFDGNAIALYSTINEENQ